MESDILLVLRKTVKEKGASRIYTATPRNNAKHPIATDGGSKRDCRAFSFMRNLGYKVKKSSQITRGLVDYWFSEGLIVFNRDDKFIDVEEDDSYIYIFLDYTSRRFTPSICQWFLFPGYTNFAKFVKKYREIRDETLLRREQVAKLVYYLITQKRRPTTFDFGHKFPFVTDSQNRPILSGVPTRKNKHSTEKFSGYFCQQMIPFICFSGMNGLPSIYSCSAIPRTFFPKKMSYEEMYRIIVKEQILYLDLYRILTKDLKWYTDSFVVNLLGTGSTPKEVVDLINSSLYSKHETSVSLRLGIFNIMALEDFINKTITESGRYENQSLSYKFLEEELRQLDKLIG